MRRVEEAEGRLISREGCYRRYSYRFNVVYTLLFFVSLSSRVIVTFLEPSE